MRRYRRVERRVHRLHAETRRESRLCRRRGTNPAERKPFEKQKSRRERLFERKGYYGFRRKRQKGFSDNRRKFHFLETRASRLFQSVERRRTGCRSGEAAIRSREKTRKKRNRRKSRRQNESRKRYSEFRVGTRFFGRRNNDRPRQLQKQKRRISSLFQKNRICIAPR